MNAIDLAGEIATSCNLLRRYFEARHRGETGNVEFEIAKASWLALERDAHAVLCGSNCDTTGETDAFVAFAMRARRSRMAMRDYLDARRRGELGFAELEVWKTLDADLERAEKRVFRNREEPGK